MTTKADQLLIQDADIQDAMKPQMAITKQELNPLVMLNEALQRNLNPETLERLMALYERWQAEQNRLKFDEALRAFKADKPEILKTKAVHYDRNKPPTFKHATLDGALDQIDPKLNLHGLSARWKPETLADGRVQVTCIVSGFGHREEYALAGPPETSGTKNPLQAIGSSVTYLQRYTLLPALGLAATEDDDGQASGSKMDDLSERLEFIENCRNEDELRNVFHAAYKKAREMNDQNAMHKLIAAKDKKRKEFA